MLSDTKALRFVALLFLLGACEAVLAFFLSFTQNRLFIPWGLLGFWIYSGLPAYRRPWRIVAIVLLLIALCVSPIVALIAIFSGAPTYIEFIGLRIAVVPLPVFLLYGSVFWALSFWQFRVLMRPTVRAAFLDPAGVTAG